MYADSTVSSVPTPGGSNFASEVYVDSGIDRPYLEPVSTSISDNDEPIYDYPQSVNDEPIYDYPQGVNDESVYDYPQTSDVPTVSDQDSSQHNDILLPSAQLR